MAGTWCDRPPPTTPEGRDGILGPKTDVTGKGAKQKNYNRARPFGEAAAEVKALPGAVTRPANGGAYGGDIVSVPLGDGTATITVRLSSDSRGPTIDVKFPDGTSEKNRY